MSGLHQIPISQHYSTIDTNAFAKPKTENPGKAQIKPELTAKVSLEGLSRNKMRVVPGLPGKVMSLASQYLPRAVLAPIVGNAYKKMGGG